MIRETVDIKVAPCKGNRSGRLTINAEDLKDGHVLFDEHAKLIESVIAVIFGMDADDKTLWTSGGKPKTECIEDVTGFPVSGKIRDEAWNTWRKTKEQ